MLLEDPDRELTLDEILSGQFDRSFQRPGPNGSNLSFTRSAWWVRFALANPSSEERRILVRQAYPLIDSIDFYHQGEAAEWERIRTGDRLPFSERPLPHQDLLFPVTLEPHSAKVFYLRVETTGAMDISLAAFTPNRLLEKSSFEQLGYGIYYGGVLVLVVYNLFIFMAVRDRAFLYYLLYIFCLGLYMSANDGLFFQFLAPNSPETAHNSLLVLLGASLLFAVQFARHILTIPQFSRNLDRAGQITIGALALTTLGTFVVPYHWVVVTLSLLTLVVMPLIMVMGIARFCSGYPPARYFLLAWTAFILGSVLYMIKVFGFLPRTYLTENGFQIGSLIEIVLLSLALGSRVSELRKQSDTDGLTAISNRRMFDTCLQREFQRSIKTGQPLSLLMIDIDHFKHFNDSFGHSTGDQVLKAVGEQLRQVVRKPMIPCRFGGEEFAIILPRASAEQAMVLAERLRSHLSQLRFNGRSITVSIGVASRTQKPFTQVGTFLRAADTALYSAKAAGRNRVSLYQLQPEAVPLKPTKPAAPPTQVPA